MTHIHKDSKLNYRFLGKSGLKVSNICLGTLTFGEDKRGRPTNSCEEYAHRIMDRFVEWGGNFLDTADVYTNGQSETIIGTWLKKQEKILSYPSRLTADLPSRGCQGKLHKVQTFTKAKDIIAASWREWKKATVLLLHQETFLDEKTRCDKGQARESMVIATKVRMGTGTGPNDEGLSRRHITAGVEQSLERLQTHYIDLYQIHCWDDGTPLEETLRTLDDLVRCGKVRYVGGSNLLGWQLQDVVSTTRSLGLNPFISLQQQYSLLCRETEWEPLHVCKLNGIGVLPWSPLKGGFLTGKYTRESPPKEGRLGWYQEVDMKENMEPTRWDEMASDNKIWQVMEALEEIARDKGKTVGQVSLRWLLQKDVVVSPIIGATSLEQLDSNMAAASGWSLTPEEMSRLDEVSRPEVPYPYDGNLRRSKGRQNSFNPSYVVSNTF